MILFVILFVFSVFSAEWDFLTDLKGYFNFKLNSREWEIQIEHRNLEEDDISVTNGECNITNNIQSETSLSGKMLWEIQDEDEDSDEKLYKGDHVSGLFSLVPKETFDEDIELEDDEEEEESKDFYEFPFHFEKTNIGFRVSTSQYIHGNEQGLCLFTIISKNAWEILFIPEKKKELMRITAKRTNIPQSSFLARYGPMILLMALMFIPKFFSNKLNNRMQQKVAEQQQQTAPPPTNATPESTPTNATPESTQPTQPTQPTQEKPSDDGDKKNK